MAPRLQSGPGFSIYKYSISRYRVLLDMVWRVMCSLHVNKIKINPGLLLSVQSRKPVHVPCVRSPWMGEVVFDVPDRPWHVGESITWKVVPDKKGHLWQGRSSSTWKVIPDKESHPWHGRSSLIRKVILDMEGHSWLERSSLTWKVIPDKEGNSWHVRSSLTCEVIPGSILLPSLWGEVRFLPLRHSVSSYHVSVVSGRGAQESWTLLSVYKWYYQSRTIVRVLNGGTVAACVSWWSVTVSSTDDDRQCHQLTVIQHSLPGSKNFTEEFCRVTHQTPCSIQTLD